MGLSPPRYATSFRNIEQASKGMFYQFSVFKRTCLLASSMDEIIDTIIRYTVESGFLTSFLTVASFVCVRSPPSYLAAETYSCRQWLTMPGNFVFLALHFCITKSTCCHGSLRPSARLSLDMTAYANSFLATLNARAHIKERAGSSLERNNSFHLPTLFSIKGRRAQRSQIVSTPKYSVKCSAEVTDVRVQTTL